MTTAPSAGLRPARVIVNTLTVGLVLVWLFPIYWIFLTSLKTPKEINKKTPTLLFEPTLENYRHLFDEFHFARILKNSTIIVGLTTAIVMVLALLAAYALARMNVPGGKHIALWMLSLRFMPPIAVVIPFFITWQKLHLTDTHLGLVLIYVAFNLPFAIWMLRGFLVEVPRDLDEAATLDGLGHLAIIRKIILPVIAPGAAVTAIFTFVFAWNEYLMALVLTSHEATTVPVTVSKFIQAYSILWGDVGASAVIELAPMLVVVFLLQRHIMRGITLGAVK
ncbi:MAG: multiple sugar transport system permease protein [Thermomicrobiales bacterium]|nr:multiple sugar transport system permease protein [Thermomicrobiales bacterium]MEA2526365.1 multiple sugar transport system permease protein [Thermomicrobiales bacterium]MEA2584461.1 multiple sugar transport system permease protein [Thermomicrobiales bacterium]